MTLTLIDARAVLGSECESEPYRWTAIEGAIHAEPLAALSGSFPSAGFELLENHQGHHHYRQWSRPILKSSCGEVLERDRDLPGVWNELIADVLSPEYVNLIAEKAHIDMGTPSIEVALWRLPVGCFNNVHANEPKKLVTHVIYMNPVWESSWGGLFEVRQGDGGNGLVRSVVPGPAQSILFVCSPQSWHAVGRVVRGERRSVAIHFYRGAIS